MIVVEVLMTSCQVSENPNNGPLRPQRTTRNTQAMKVSGLPAHSEMLFAKRVNSLLISAKHPAKRKVPRRPVDNLKRPGPDPGRIRASSPDGPSSPDLP